MSVDWLITKSDHIPLCNAESAYYTWNIPEKVTFWSRWHFRGWSPDCTVPLSTDTASVWSWPMGPLWHMVRSKNPFVKSCEQFVSWISFIKWFCLISDLYHAIEQHPEHGDFTLAICPGGFFLLAIFFLLVGFLAAHKQMPGKWWKI